MDTLISKSTFYDVVSMIIPGFITLFSLAIICGCNMCLFCKNNPLVIPNYICISVLSYMIGFFIHRLSRFIFDCCLRNDPYSIRCEKIRFLKKRRIREKKGKVEKIEKDERIVHNYYMQYYNVIQPNSVPVMEAQVAFIRSMVIVIPIICFAIHQKGYSIDCCNLHLCTCFIIMSLLLFGTVLVFLMFYIQCEIYYRVFEDSYYVGLVNEKKPSLDGADNKTKKEDATNKVKDGKDINK